LLDILRGTPSKKAEITICLNALRHIKKDIPGSKEMND